MCCIVELIMSVFGIVIIVTGKFAVSGNRYCYGTPARLAGACLTATLPLAFGGGILFGVVMGVNAASNKQQLDMTQLQLMGAGIDIAVVVLCLAGALAIGLTNLEPKRKPKRQFDDAYDREFDSARDEDDNAPPRRRRRRRRDEDDDAPPDDRIQSEGR